MTAKTHPSSGITPAVAAGHATKLGSTLGNCGVSITILTSSHHDGIVLSLKIIGYLETFISAPLTWQLSFIKCLTCIFPDSLKVTKVKPLFKGNGRHISLCFPFTVNIIFGIVFIDKYTPFFQSRNLYNVSNLTFELDIQLS